MKKNCMRRGRRLDRLSDALDVFARALAVCQLSLCIVFASAAAPASDGAAYSWQEMLRRGEHARELGNIDESIETLQRALREAGTAVQRVRAQTQLGLSLAQSGRLSEADRMLQMAYTEMRGEPRYSIALALGNVAFQAHDPGRAKHYYEEAAAGGTAPEQLKLRAELNLVRLRPELDRLAHLELLLPRIEAVPDPAYRAHALLGVGQLASALLEPVQIARPEEFERTLQLSYRSIVASRELALTSDDAPLAVDAGDALAQLYESQNRTNDAATLNRGVIAEAARLPVAQGAFPLVRLEWRAARLQERRGETPDALASFLRAAQHLESIRRDLPIDDAGGRSTYLTLQRPIFAGMLDLLLGNVDGLAPNARQARLATGLNAIELAHQAELQDYLGDRCSVDSVRAGTNAALEPGLAVVYPVIIKNRLEVLVRTSSGVLHHAVSVSSTRLSNQVQNFRDALLDAGSNEFMSESRQLYDWLMAPFSDALDQAGVRELVIVPDGVLRLIPFAVLHDGRQFLAQRYWVSTATGLSMTEPRATLRKRPASLLAGLSTPGPVIDRLLAMGFTGNAALTSSAAARGLVRSIERPDAAATDSRSMTLRGELQLPGARTEIQDIARGSHSLRLIDDGFTVARFAQEVQSGDYTIVHVASHGFFGASVSESFLLAYDDVIRIDELQRLMSVNDAQMPGIDLLTLSACDTATGDERAPLGFAGAGIKARARSVVGSLWAVSDAATQKFMQLFYANLPQHGKAEALTLAQRSLMQSPEFAHPYFWAPFILTGDWN